MTGDREIDATLGCDGCDAKPCAFCGDEFCLDCMDDGLWATLGTSDWEHLLGKKDEYPSGERFAHAACIRAAAKRTGLPGELPT